MRGLLLLVVGALLGAALFHAYYLRQDARTRCRWDHPINEAARSRCQEFGQVKGYGEKARKDLDSLINEVSN